MKDSAREETIFGESWPYSKAKTALLKSAAVVIRDKGPRAATLKNIAAKAGVTEPAIFRHFDGVDGLFDSLYSAGALFRQRFAESLKSGAADGTGGLEAAVASFLQIVKDNAEYAYVIANPDPLFRQYPHLKSKLEDSDESIRTGAIECVKAAKSAGQLVPGIDPETLANLALEAVFGVIGKWSRNVESGDPVKEGRKAVGALLSLSRLPGTEKASDSKSGKAKARR